MLYGVTASIIVGLIIPLINTNNSSVNAAPLNTFRPLNRADIEIRFLSRTQLEIIFPNTPAFNNTSTPTWNDLFSGTFTDSDIDGQFVYAVDNPKSCTDGAGSEVRFGPQGNTDITGGFGQLWYDLQWWDTSKITNFELRRFCIPEAANIISPMTMF